MDVRDQIRAFPSSVKNQKNSNRKMKKSGKKPLKVVYISSPMKVTATAAGFRSIVQELTGKNSDISHYMEGGDFHEVVADGAGDFGGNHHRPCGTKDDRRCSVFSSSISSEDTSTTTGSVDSFLGSFDDVFISSRMDEGLGGILSSSGALCDMGDVLGSYDELL